MRFASGRWWVGKDVVFRGAGSVTGGEGCAMAWVWFANWRGRGDCCCMSVCGSWAERDVGRRKFVDPVSARACIVCGDWLMFCGACLWLFILWVKQIEGIDESASPNSYLVFGRGCSCLYFARSKNSPFAVVWGAPLGGRCALHMSPK